MRKPDQFLESLFKAAVSAANPTLCLPSFLNQTLDKRSIGRTIVIGAGKASAAMAQTTEEFWKSNFPEHILEGLVITRYGHGVPCQWIEVVEAAHPIPDSTGHDAAIRLLTVAKNAKAEDLVLCLISGGGSSLLSLPADDISLADKQKVTSELLKSGATIHEINCVRKHLSAVKGGRLASATAPATLKTFAISDVPGDQLDVIASGPTVADSTYYNDALLVLEKYGVEGTEAVIKRLSKSNDETPKPGDSIFTKCENFLIATPQIALEAAAERARSVGVTPIILGDAIEGEAKEVARVHAGIASQVARHNQPSKPPVVLISGGETTVTLKGKGRGGRNTEFLLSLAISLDERSPDCVHRISAIACDTDGIDGTEDNAGAIYLPDTIQRAKSKGISPADNLVNNDGYTFFESIGNLVFSGPTLTNVNDFRAILIT